MKKQRPVNLQLNTISFPPAAISSILHRVSGVIMLVLVGLLVWLLANSLQSPEGFAQAQSVFAHPVVKFLVWGFLTALGYHLLAGIRHMVMDLGIWEERESGNASAVVTIVLAVILAVLAGVWLW
ncbi:MULTISPECIES: succinate dehydrogenase, cytochrome b556 subunit [Gammaproteobacteria]|uniref:succinate dehydrogenase, cytochrome b556 subunit n=1 Tax=Gammaproteobacteria TaxID=1236 RepID=UPI000DCF65EC|nr:succinate dehydrogenase, cytochrome b556 subunit [Aliidiomarina sp. B3213]RTE87365.1 succinate dehydrogenase, cytochrome b556 subunit [Aliidiomarina sp. B3213]TCZ92849.1 succinate dehydrogenase, cytochrome b556 subunit [Lysobacter sp. N42]